MMYWDSKCYNVGMLVFNVQEVVDFGEVLKYSCWCLFQIVLVFGHFCV